MINFTKTTLYISLLILFNINVNAQSQGIVYEQFNNATVSAYGNTLSAPWCGGLNSFQIQKADLNNDSKKDLILFDQNNNLLKTFLNVSSFGEVKYAYAPQFEKHFPAALSFTNYLILKDYNCDGIPDLFHNGNYGVSVYKGYYVNNELNFIFYKNVWAKRVLQNDSINAYVQNNDIPSIEDIDGDGDLDITSFDVQGIYTVLHKNMRVEWGLPCDSIKLIIADKCYGKFFQTFNREHILGSLCSPSMIVNNKKNRHTGNCILQIDIDGDGDFDLMGGNISFLDAQLLINGGGANNQMTSQDTTYNKLGHQLYMPSWPSSFHADIDNDGDLDLLFTSHSDDASTANYNTISFYKNIGNATMPNYVYANDSVFVTEMIDVGSYSYPTFFDFNKDGKKDLFIGSEGYLDNNSGLTTSKLAYYKNTSTLGNISFQLVTKDFLNLSTKNYNGIFPTFGDISGDGIDDLIFGGTKGNIAVYTNNSSSNSVLPNFIFSTDSIPNMHVGNHSMPAVVDFNLDGKNDLFVGNKIGHLAYYEDTSSSSTPKFALKTITIGNMKAGKPSQFYGYSAPFIGKIDNTDSTFLLIGNIDGNIERYDSFRNNYGLFKKLDSNYSFIKTSNRAVPAVADLDGDGKYEMVVGNKMGGLYYFKQVLTILNTSSETFDANAFEVYPNPTTDNIHILFKENYLNKNAFIKIIDLMGNVVLSNKQVTSANNTISINHFTNGLYFLEIEIEHQKSISKIIKN